MLADLIIAGGSTLGAFGYATGTVTAYYVLDDRRKKWESRWIVSRERWEGDGCADCSGGFRRSDRCVHWERNRYAGRLSLDAPSQAPPAVWVAPFWPAMLLGRAVRFAASRSVRAAMWAPKRAGRKIADLMVGRRADPNLIATLERELGMEGHDGPR